MPAAYTLAEIKALTELGSFAEVGGDGVIGAAAAVVLPAVAPIPASFPPAVETITAWVAGYNIMVLRAAFSGSDIPNAVYYELYSEDGYAGGDNLRQSNLELPDLHIRTSDFIIIRFWNVSAPAAAVYYDWTLSYFVWPDENTDRVMAIMNRTPDTLAAILKELQRR